MSSDIKQNEILMAKNKFKMCPMCGSAKIEYKDARKWICPDCGFDLYNNVASAVGVIICDVDGSVLFEKRAKEPKKGMLTIPGGFCDYDETAEEAALRECREEISLVPSEIRYIASFPNNYEYKNVHYKTCDMFFSARLEIPDGKKLIDLIHAQETEVTGFVTEKISCEEDIQRLPIAFDSVKKALAVWLKTKN